MESRSETTTGMVELEGTRIAVKGAVPATAFPLTPDPILQVRPARSGAIEHPIDQIAALIERFVFFKSRCLYRLLALWVAATHIHQAFDFTGYVFVFSAEPQSGKSRLLEVLELLVANPSGILVSPSGAVLFRTAANHTQFIDELDGLTKNNDLRSVLNAGFHKGATVLRMERHDGEYAPIAFPVYAPRVLAGIGNKILSTTTRDRTFTIEMVRQLPSERRQRFQAHVAKPNTDEIKNALATWLDGDGKSIVDCFEHHDFPYLQDCRDRTIDVARPLAAIMEVAYEGDELQRARRELVEAIALTRSDQEPLGDDHRVLEALTALARDEDPLVGSATELSVRCATILEQNPKDIPITAVLRRYGFQTKSIRAGGSRTPRYRYSLPLEALVEILSRYGSVGEAAGSHRRAEASA